MAKQIFYSHAWGKDGDGRDSHTRVKILKQEMEALGWTSWFDEEDMGGNTRKAMISGIGDAEAVVVCLTGSYLQKIEAECSDNCKFEWDTSIGERKIMVPVVMETSLRTDPKNWPRGQVSRLKLKLTRTILNALRRQVKSEFLQILFVDFSSDDCEIMRAKAKELHKSLVKRGLRPLHGSVEVASESDSSNSGGSQVVVSGAPIAKVNGVYHQAQPYFGFGWVSQDHPYYILTGEANCQQGLIDLYYNANTHAYKISRDGHERYTASSITGTWTATDDEGPGPSVQFTA